HELPRAMASARKELKEGHTNSYSVKLEIGDALPLPIDTDGGAVEAGEVSITFLSRLTHHDLEGETGAEAALANLLAR
ncbi:MAG: 5-nucleotidase SurE, partial [Actinomycetota bacterium]